MALDQLAKSSLKTNLTSRHQMENSYIDAILRRPELSGEVAMQQQTALTYRYQVKIG